jgi:low temperature requirement protein LtrA
MTGGAPAAETSGQPPGGDELPLRVSTLEIFFDLVFAFTLTQLTSVLATRLSWLAVLQVLLVFGLLWWMYGAYAWLTNARPPVRTAERLLLLVGMTGSSWSGWPFRAASPPTAMSSDSATSSS